MPRPDRLALQPGRSFGEKRASAGIHGVGGRDEPRGERRLVEQRAVERGEQVLPPILLAAQQALGRVAVSRAAAKAQHPPVRDLEHRAMAFGTREAGGCAQAGELPPVVDGRDAERDPVLDLEEQTRQLGLAAGRIPCELGQDRRHVGDLAAMVDRDVTERAARHRGRRRLGRLLDDGDAVAILDREQAGGAIVELPGQHDADDGRAIGKCRAAKQRIDRWPGQVLLRTVRQPDDVSDDEHVTIGRSDVDVSRHERLAILRVAGRE